MVDVREPVEIALPGGALLCVGMKWKGRKDPVLTGDQSMFAVLVENRGGSSRISGSLHFVMALRSSYPSLWANPQRVVQFAVDPGKTVEVAIPNEWLFVEGKAAYVLNGCQVDGLNPNPAGPLDHPMSSFTVFERSTYISSRNQSLTTLLLAAAAAAASVASVLLAAALAFHWPLP